MCQPLPVLVEEVAVHAPAAARDAGGKAQGFHGPLGQGYGRVVFIHPEGQVFQAGLHFGPAAEFLGGFLENPPHLFKICRKFRLVGAAGLAFYFTAFADYVGGLAGLD